MMGDPVHRIAIHIGPSVGYLAGPGDVHVSRTLMDPVAGSGLAFEDAGENVLKRVSNRWRRYRAVA